LLYAGPGAMLSHATAAWWIGLVEHQPRRIDVSTPRRCRSVPGIRVHPRRHHERTSHKGLPVTRFEQTLVDYASTASLNDVRLALARADYQGSLNAPALAAGLQPGRPGGARLRRALERHLPDLARTRSRIERALLRLCETHDLPLPEVNVRIAGWEVDAVWREQRIVVEVDGLGNHRTPAQIRRDRRKEMALRAAGFVVLRYSDEQIFRQAREVAEELRQMLGPATAPPPGPAPGGGPPGPLAAGTPPTY
ncbi:MAG TPA: DUF559 domain-containing protein, partial [Solirubrobacteraceae bacterium]|nr:DUF559 domain-containing protein [Solirubrobacteraceae bacterium]